MTGRILQPTDVTLVTRPKREKRGRRPLEPKLFARVEGNVWALYVSVYREGEFRRIALPLEAARVFLDAQRAAVADVPGRTLAEVFLEEDLERR